MAGVSAVNRFGGVGAGYDQGRIGTLRTGSLTASRSGNLRIFFIALCKCGYAGRSRLTVSVGHSASPGNGSNFTTGRLGPTIIVVPANRGFGAVIRFIAVQQFLRPTTHK